MRLMRLGSWQEARLARWVARGISLIIGLSLLLLIVLNEDFRTNPTLPTIILWLMSLSLLLAWRWERVGALSTLLLTPILLIALVVQWTGLGGLLAPFWQLAMVALASILPFLIAAWLYLSAHQYAETIAAGEAFDLPEQGSRRTTVVIILLGLAALVLYFVPLLIPVQQQITESP